jgi:hypothetical protein
LVGYSGRPSPVGSPYLNQVVEAVMEQVAPAGFP